METTHRDAHVLQYHRDLLVPKAIYERGSKGLHPALRALLMRATYLTLSYRHHVRSRFMSSERAWLAREAVARLL